jgi:CPA2 family monovalent cation:H+ antiporter-2
VAARTGIYLAQAGEFGFVLLTLGLAQGLIDPRWSNPVLAAMVLSMLATPFLIQHADRLVFRFSPDDWLSQSLQITTIASHAIAIDQHVLVCGFGHTGRNLCQLLAQQNISYIALDVNPEVVKTAVLDGHQVEVGDSFQLSNLVSAGLNRASAVVVSFDDTVTALGVISLVHKHAPTVPVLVRTRDEHDMVLLKQAGAHEVIPDAFEVSLSLATHTMSLLGVEEEKINQLVFIQRHTQYAGLKETAILGSEKP